jgi:probable HAF family extracellular repeat protein
MSTRILVLALAVGALVAPTATAASAVQVSAAPALVSLGTLGGDDSYPAAVNDRGQVVGVSETADGELHAFFWENGVMIDLAPTYASSAAADINNKGQVVFQRAPAGGPVESVLWSRTATISLGIVNARFVNEKGQVAGTVLNLDDPTWPNTNPFLWERGVRTDMGPIPGWGADSRAVDFNDKGVVLGAGLGPESFELGFLWSGGGITPIGDPSAFGGNGVVDLNNRGQVLGASFTNGAFIWDSGVFTYLGSVPGRLPSEPAALNEAGWVAGTSGIEGGDEAAFLWRDGVFTIVGPEGTASRSVDLNDRGQVIGTFWEPVGDELRAEAFLWQKGELFDLGEGIGGGVNVVAISEKGHIIGTVADASGSVHAVMWTTG